MTTVELAIVGAGPAGLSAAIEASKNGVHTVLFDENNRPGGQLFKQIHKFFGSKHQMAGMRGYEIGNKLLELAEKYHVNIHLNSQVIGIDPSNTLAVIKNNKYFEVKARRIILCCGATENPLAFPGWTLPGVMGAGAAQTMVNIHRVIPGKKILMVGSGNVGLIVAYHLLQAGAKIQAIIDASPTITGYVVHAAKLKRAGIPLLLGCTIHRAIGKDQVEEVEIIQVDQNFRKIPSTERKIDADTVCLAVGLSPSTELARMIGCKLYYNSKLGGYVPKVNEYMQTSNKDIYAAGDITGVEEASIAMEEGKLAGLCCAIALGYYSKDVVMQKQLDNVKSRLHDLRGGILNE